MRKRKQNEVVVKEILTDSGLRAGMHETVEVGEEGEEIDEAHTTDDNSQSSTLFLL